MKKTGIMICGHGSRSKAAGEEFGLLATGLRRRYPDIPIEYGFLEYSAPNIHMGLDSLVAQGVTEIFAVPGMLFAATHVKNDIPSVLTTYMEKHPGLTIHYGRELGLHPNMIHAFEARILESLGMTKAPHHGELYDTMLVVVGRGTSDTWANAEVAKLSRIVAEDLGFGWTEIVYSGVTYPSVGRGLEMALKLGYKRIVVAPYFLFAGRLIDRIYDYVDVVAEQHPEVEIIKAHYLKDQEYVLETFMARVKECQQGEYIDDHDLMRSFQERLARGEVEIHHHHAEYQPEDHSHDHHHGHAHDHHHHDHSHDHSHDHHHHGHDHHHSHDHSHGHHHGYYKHVAHPHGPRTMIDENICHCFMRQIPDEIIEEERRLRAERGAVAYRDKPPH